MKRFTLFFRNRKSRIFKKKSFFLEYLRCLPADFKVWHIKKRGIKRAFQRVWFRDSTMVRSRVMAILHVSFHVFVEYLRCLPADFKVWHIKKRGIKRAFQRVWFRDSAMVRSRVMAILHVSFHVFGEYLRDITPKGSPVLEKYLRDVIGRPLSRCTCVGSQRMRLFCMFVVSLFQQLIDVI